MRDGPDPPGRRARSTLYARPVDAFVATFVGDADVAARHSPTARTVVTPIGALALDVAGAPRGPVDVVVRPERVRLRLDGAGEGVVTEHRVLRARPARRGRASADGTHVRAPGSGPVRVLVPGDRVSVAVVGDVLAFATVNGAGTPVRVSRQSTSRCSAPGRPGSMAALARPHAAASVIVLERAPAPGGLAASFEVAGVRVDHGSHRLHRSCPPEILDELRSRARRRPAAAPPQRPDPARRPLGRVPAAASRPRPPPPADARRRALARATPRRARSAAPGPTRSPRSCGPVSVPRWPTSSTSPYVAEDLGRRPGRAQRRARPPPRRRRARRAHCSAGCSIPERRERGTFLYPRRGFGADRRGARGAAARAWSGHRLRRGGRGATRAHATTVPRSCTDGGRHRGRDQVWSTLPLPVVARSRTPPAGVRGAAERGSSTAP